MNDKQQYAWKKAVELSHAQGGLYEETILAVDARLSELEALSTQAMVAQLISSAEWEALTPQSRHRMNVWMQAAEKLAEMVLAHAAELRIVILPNERERMIYLARKIAGERAVADAPHGLPLHSVTIPNTLAPGVHEIFGGPQHPDEGETRFGPVDGGE